MKYVYWSRVVTTSFCVLWLALYSRSAVSGSPITIGLSLGLTGVYAAPAQMQRRAYALWAKQINESGGLLGRPVELIIDDDQSRPENAARIYRSLITERGVDLIFGPYSSAITAAVVEVTERHGFSLLAAGASADTLWRQGYRHLFGMWVPATQYTHGMLRLAAASGLKRIAVIHADDSFSEAIRAGTQRWSQYLPVDIVSVIGFEKGSAHLDGAIERSMKETPDVIIVGGHFSDAVNVRKALARWLDGTRDVRTPAFYATVGPALVSWHRVMGPLADGAYSTSIWEPSVRFPNAERFARSFESRFGVEPSYHAATAYAAGQLLAVAVERAQKLDRTVLRNVLSELDTNTIIGRYGVDRTGMQVKSVPLIVQWRGGRKIIVWPGPQRLGGRQ